jgi:imidazolonepropionase-like amidohydrolase
VIQVLAAVIVIHAGALLADPGTKPLHEQTVVITDGKISAVENGYQPTERYGADARLIDLRDRFVLPGLIDLHKHISMPLDEEAISLTSESRLALMTAAVAKAALDAGVTTLRDAGDNVGVTLAVRDAINAGVIEGPRIFAAGRIISSTGGHGTTKDFQEIEYPRGGCDGPESCRRVVRENIEAGSDWIKMTVSGSGGAPSGLADAEPIMLAEEVRAVTEAARRGLRPVAAHAHSTAAIKLALESGARTIEHGTYFDDACARLFKSKGAFLVPTAYVAEFVGKQVEKFSADPRRLAPEALRRWTQNAMANPGRACARGRVVRRERCARRRRDCGRDVDQCRDPEHARPPRTHPAGLRGRSHCDRWRSTRRRRQAAQRSVRDEGRSSGACFICTLTRSSCGWRSATRSRTRVCSPTIASSWSRRSVTRKLASTSPVTGTAT